MAKGKSKSLKDIWNKGKKNAGDTELIPVDTGQYTFQLLKGEPVDGKGNRMALLHWGVVSAKEDDDVGKVCKNFYNLEDADRIVWLQRDLKTLGIDLEEYTVESEDDLFGLIDELIEDNACALVQVVEKDGYVNMRVKKRVEVDNDELLDRDDTLAGKGGSDSDDDDDDDGDDSGDEFEVGDEVTWTDSKGNEKSGKITEINEDDEVATVRQEGKKRGTKVPLDDLESADDDDDDDADGDGDDDDAPDYDSMDAKALKALCDEREIIVKKSERKNAKKLKAKLEKWDEENADDDGDDDSSDDDDDDDGDADAEGFEVGDEVAFDLDGKEKEGTITKLDGDVATVKVGKKKHKVNVEDLDALEDGPEFDVGDAILVKGKKHVITEVDEDGETVKAKPAGKKGKGKKAVTIPFDEVEYETD